MRVCIILQLAICSMVNRSRPWLEPGILILLLLAVLLKIFRHDFRSVTLVFTILMALATWSAFEVIRLRLGGLTATVFLVCSTFYIRIHCAGLFMTEQLGLLYSLCAVAMLVESLARRERRKPGSTVEVCFSSPKL